MSEDDNIPLNPRELLEEMILAIVTEPDHVNVLQISDKDEPEKMILEVKVSDNDRGIVIGRNGFVAQLLRNYLGLMGQRLKQRIEVRIDAGPNHRPKPKKQSFDPNFKHRNENSQNHKHPVIPNGYVMVPASQVISVPDSNYNHHRQNGHGRPRRQYRDTD